MGNPLHSEYCNCECPAGNSYVKLEETLNRVRMLHVATASGLCLSCTMLSNKEWRYPCPTMQALQGDDE
jgi:hypothetical protein